MIDDYECLPFREPISRDRIRPDRLRHEKPGPYIDLGLRLELAYERKDMRVGSRRVRVRTAHNSRNLRRLILLAQQEAANYVRTGKMDYSDWNDNLSGVLRVMDRYNIPYHK